MKSFTSYFLDSPFVPGRVFDVFEPETVTQDIALFFVHGGGWHAGSRTIFHKIMEAFNARGYLCASTDYRLNVDAFGQLADIREAYDCFMSLLKERKRPLKIAVYGSSAGSHLASLMVCAAPGECGEQCRLTNDWVKPLCGIFHATPHSFVPWESMMPGFRLEMQKAAGGIPYEKDPGPFERLSLNNYIRKDNPRLFFVEAELEHLFMSEYNLEFVKKHREWGIPSQWKVYHRVEHGFFYELVRKAQKEAFEDICLFLNGELKTI